MSDDFKVQRHTFQPGAMSIIQMGEELIGHPTTAINELVKNGYDADATESYVYIHIDEENPFVLIFDNGLGMYNSTLFGDWLKPSISSKRWPGAKSEIFERSFLGSKGIGRLAAMALGKILTVITKRLDEQTYNWLSLDSSLFRSDQLLSKVNFPGDVIEEYQMLFEDDGYLKLRAIQKNQVLLKLLKKKPFKDFKEGTLIIIEDVDDSLKTIFQKEFEDQNEIEDSLTIQDTAVYKSLSVLATPLMLDGQIQKELFTEKIINVEKRIANSNNTFTIFFGTNAIKDLFLFEFIDVKSIPIIDKFDYRIIGKVDRLGSIQGKFHCKRIERLAFKEDFNITNEEVFEKEFRRLKDIRAIEELRASEWNRDAGEFYFDIRIYDRGEDDSKEKLYSLIQANTLSQKKKILDGLLGLRISKNGFGVKPYGEEVKDWLGLGQLRVQNPGQNVSTNQILGYIFFYSPENDNLREKTNREGFYENKAFLDVQHILQVVFKNVGRLRYIFRLRNNIGRIPKNRLQRPDAARFIEFLKTQPDEKSILKKSEEFVAEVTTALDNMEDTLSFSQRLASLGTGLELVYHELGQPISKIGGSRAVMSRKTSKIEDAELRQLFIKEISNIGSFVSALDELKDSLRPAIGKSIQETFKPNHTFKKVCYLFRKDISDDQIELQIDPNSEKFQIEDYEYPLWISFLNIVNNAVYWLKLNGAERKCISFSMKNNEIAIANNGPFIPEDHIDLIFEYGFTLKKEKSATGLGLAFTKNILNLHNWNITAENWEEGPAFIISKL